MGSALVRGGELVGIGSVRHRGSFWQLLTEATSVAPLLPKPCHANPVHTWKAFVVSVITD